MAERKYLIVVNPISGTSGKQKLAEFAEKCMTSMGILSRTIYTGGRGDALRFAQEAAAEGYEGVVAIGGDGTVNEVASGLRETDTVLGIVPMGSGNGLARHLGLPLDPAEAVKVILRGKTLRCDYATANGKPFFCTFGTGFDARVSHEFSKCKRRGKFAYLRVIIRESKSFRPDIYKVTASGADGPLIREAFILAVCNSSQYGNNAFIAPHASLTDGILDLTVVNTANPIDLVRNSFDLFTGLITDNGRFETLRSEEFTIEGPHGTEPMEVHLDGEPYLLTGPIHICCHHAGLSVFCGGEPQFKPIITPITGAIRDVQSAITKPLH